MVTSGIASAASRQAIATALAVHSRGVDRADANLLASAYHSDATVDYGFFEGSANEFASVLAAAQKRQPLTLHRTSNLWIKVDGDRALSESYVIACIEEHADSIRMQRMIGGRYLDTHAQCDAGWKLTHRKYVMDFNVNRRSASSDDDPPLALANFGPRGGHGAADPGRAFLAFYAARFNTSGNSTVTNDSSASQLHGLLAGQALHDLNMAYARAVDRADADLLGSVFHDDATVVTGLFNGNGAEYARHVTSFIRENFARCFHSVANEWYDVQGDRAIGETYVIAALTAQGTDTLTAGRYLDAYEYRDGAWKISHRVFVVDWSNAQPTSHATTGMYAALTTHGCFGKDDPVYAFWNA